MAFRHPLPPAPIDPPQRLSEETLDAWGVDPIDRIAHLAEEARAAYFEAEQIAERKGLSLIRQEASFRLTAAEDFQSLLSEWGDK